MKNKLEEFVNRNRESFDSEKPVRDVLKEIEKEPIKPKNAQTDQVDHVIPWQSDQVFYWQNN
jgi:hypothetical protein